MPKKNRKKKGTFQEPPQMPPIKISIQEIDPSVIEILNKKSWFTSAEREEQIRFLETCFLKDGWCCFDGKIETELRAKEKLRMLSDMETKTILNEKFESDGPIIEEIQENPNSEV